MSEVTHPATGNDPIVAKADSRYRLKWVVMGIVLLAGGAYFLYDGYVGYPRKNAESIQAAKDQGKPVPDKMPNSDTDILLQKVIGYALQPIGVFTLFWTFYSSRGEYRLANGVLHTPGHPNVGLESIRAIDKSKWDRKGIAFIDYEEDAGRNGRVKLDDYVYERKPTDKILERIEALAAGEPTSSTAGSEDGVQGI